MPMFRSGGMYGARMKSRSDFYLADLPPGSVEDTRGKSEGGSVGGGRIPPPISCAAYG